MMDLLSDSLGLDQTNYLQTHITQYNPVVLPRMFRYLPQSPDATEIHWGIGRHSDYGLWTMLLTDQPGLEFQLESSTNEWVAVPFVKHGIIMNVGDAFLIA